MYILCFVCVNCVVYLFMYSYVCVCVCVASDSVCLLVCVCVCVRIGVVCGCLGDNGEKVEMESYKSDVTY